MLFVVDDFGEVFDDFGVVCVLFLCDLVYC